MLERCRAVRRLGAATLNLAYLAAGRLDAYRSSRLAAWDVAAGMLLVTEAGGTVTHVDGAPLTLGAPAVSAAATATLHQALSDVTLQDPEL